jgi:hypothetical protein
MPCYNKTINKELKMLKNIENKLEKFAKISGLTERVTISHGTLYALLVQPERCDFFHKVMRDFYKENINPDGGVNMYAVGDEFAFDFVEGNKDNYFDETDESPAFPSYTEEPEDSIIDTMIELENESKKGK